MQEITLSTPVRIDAPVLADTPDILVTYVSDIIRRCHEDATRKLLTWNSSLIASAPVSMPRPPKHINRPRGLELAS